MNDEEEKRTLCLKRAKPLSEEIADALDLAGRCGSETDEPEGSRYIIVSDTLARRWARLLREETR